MKPRDFGAIFLLGSIWGASYLFIKVGVATIPPTTFVAGRVFLAAVVSFVILRLRGVVMPTTWLAWRSFAVMGLLNGAIPYILITWGEQYVDSGLAAILIGATPLFTVIFAQFVLPDERLTLTKALGIGLGFLGVAVLIGPDALAGIGVSLLGDLALVGASISYAAAIIWSRLQTRRQDPMAATTGQLVMATVYMLPIALLVGQPWRSSLDPLGADLPAFASLITLAILCTSIAYLIYYWLVAQVGATQTSLVTYISPFTGIVWGALFLGERLDMTAFVGFALILLGMGLITGVTQQTFQRRGNPGASVASKVSDRV